MQKYRIAPLLAFIGLLLAFLAAATAAFAAVAPAADARGEGEALRARFAQMRDEVRQSDFGRPLKLVSLEGDHRLQGDVYAMVGHPYAEVNAALHEADQWCEVLVLPFNTKGCTSSRGDGTTLTIFIGKRKDATIDNSYRIDFRYRVEARAPDYLRVALQAPEGPIGTRDYRIVLEATPLDGGHSIIHLAYSYAYGRMGQLAMQSYLATFGAEKVGFTVERRDAEGHPVFVRGMRGVMERNTMRYFLAIEAYLDSLSAPPGERLERRLTAWFDATENFRRQLHELPREQYLAMKHREARAAATLAGS